MMFNWEYALYCKLTCIGGSEFGLCPCTTPADCKNKDKLEEAREHVDAGLHRIRLHNLGPPEVDPRITDRLEKVKKFWNE